MISRRAVTIGGLAAMALPAAARAASTLVPFQLRVFIPSPAVSYVGVFSGGDKAIVEGTIDLAKSGAAALSVTTRKLGPTKKYADSAAIAMTGKPDWYVALVPGAAPIQTGQADLTAAALSASWDVPAGATHGVKIVVDAANPLIALAPAINAEIRIGLRAAAGGAAYWLSAEHDGFPNYQVKLGAGALVHDYDCVVAGDTPFALMIPMERETVTPTWLALPL